MKQYLNLLKHVLDNGTEKSDRTGTGTISVFGYQMRFDLSKGFPLVTTKNVPFRLIVSELLWFLSGNTNVKYLHDNNNHIWDEWINENGDLGRVYGAQWRSWTNYVYDDERGGLFNEPIDQISWIINEIKRNPDSRRLIVSAWNPAEIDQMALPPCHTLFQFYVVNNKLSCQLFQRSSDLFLGAPFNIASYALLTHMIAQVTGLDVGEFIHTLGDAHIYKNHVEQVKLQLTREPYPLPILELNPDVKSIFDFKIEDIKLHNYNHYPTIKGDVSI